MKRFFTFTLSLLLPALLLAQSKVTLNPGGSIAGPANEVLKIRTAVNADRGFSKITPYDQSLDALNGTIDTLNWAPHSAYNVNFGFFGQDYMVQWFEAPTEMDITAVSVMPSDDENTAISVKLVSMAWDRDQIQSTQSTGPAWWGYYEATGNGFNDVGGFEEDSDVTGAWIEKGQGETNQWGSPFGADLWSDLGEGAPITIENGVESWVSMDLLGFNPQVVTGELFGVVTKNDGQTLDAGRSGWLASNQLGITGFKLYRNGRLSADDYGWWTRLYSWDFNVAVVLTGDRAPVIASMTSLPTTLSTDPRTVDASITDDNPSGGSAGVASATLYYVVDGDTNSVAMTGTEPDFSGVIPGFAPGSEVTYYIVATDVNDLSTSSQPVTYTVFEAVNTILVAYDDTNFGIGTINAFWLSGLPSDTNWYWGVDFWEAPFGPLSVELLSNYEQLYHIMGDGPFNSPPNPGPVYMEWMKQATAESHRNLLLTGQDYGYISGFADTTFPVGSFERDYLGVETLGGQDINYGPNGNDETLPWIIEHVSGDILTGWMDVLYANNDTSVLSYNPTGPLGLSNWIDNMTLDAGTAILTDPNNGGAAVAARN